MALQEIDFSKTLNDEQVFETIMGNYSNFSKDWIIHQWNWMNNVYWAFKDHYKYMIIISLVEKTLQFYDQMNIQYSYDEYYSKSYQQIEKFSITELCEKLDLPKETVRRKVLELEKEGVITRNKKKIIIDRKAFPFVKPDNQIKFSAKYIYLVSQALNKDKVYSKKPDQKTIDRLLEDKFTSTDWKKHTGFDKGLFVNASSWAFFLTGNILKRNKLDENKLEENYKSFIKKNSEPVFRTVVRKAVMVLAKQFVFKAKMDEAVKFTNSEKYKRNLFSFDMLGEGARTDEDAHKYYLEYLKI